MQSKDEIRQFSKEYRETIGASGITELSQVIVNKLRECPEYLSAKRILSYYPIEGLEISLLELFSDNKEWYLPVQSHIPNANNLLVVPYNHGETKLIDGKYGIYEPEIIANNFYDQVERKIELDLIFVPGLAFDKQGYRVGFGKGYYDRFLQLNPNSFKVGVCPEELLLDEIPRDNWDLPVNLIVHAT